MDAWLLSLVVPDRAAAIMDAGCGSGVTAMVLTAMGFSSVRVVDIPDYRVTDFLDRDRYLALFGLKIEKCDLMTDPLPAADQSLDVVSCNDTIEHLDGSPKAFLQDAFRALKPGGAIIISTPNAVSLRHRLAMIAGISNYTRIESFYESETPYRGHVREFTMPDLRYALQAAGFEVHRRIFYNTFFKDLYTMGPDGILRRRTGGRPRLKLFLRRVLWTVTRVTPSLRDSLAIIGRKPRGPRVESAPPAW